MCERGLSVKTKLQQKSMQIYSSRKQHFWITLSKYARVDKHIHGTHTHTKTYTHTSRKMCVKMHCVMAERKWDGANLQSFLKSQQCLGWTLLLSHTHRNKEIRDMYAKSELKTDMVRSKVRPKASAITQRRTRTETRHFPLSKGKQRL